MATKEENQLAGRMVFFGIIDRKEMGRIMKEKAASEEAGEPLDLGSLLVDRGLASKAEVDALSDIPLTETQPIPDYRIERKIAEGGMAAVYLATYRPLREKVALKVMAPELARREKFRLRFLREAKLLMKLEHENIVKGFEIRRDAGYIFCAMEHVDGATVEERIESDGPFSESQALYVVREVANALGYLDSRGVVHRDLKPGNILVTESGAVKLIDLGLAKLQGGMTADAEAGITVGTVEYLSPEQARGLEDVDIRSDIYSLGVTLFHMLVGEVPFKGETSDEVIAKQVLHALASPELKSRRISAFAHYFIQKLMAKDREDRYQHPEEVIQAIEEQGGPVGFQMPVARPIGRSPVKGEKRPRRPLRSKRRAPRKRPPRGRRR